MKNPYPPELLLAASSVTWEWGDEYPGASTAGKETVDEMLKRFKLENGMIVLMAKAEELEAVLGLSKQDVWEKEPWYGTQYRFERFDEDFLRQASSATIAESRHSSCL